MPILIVIIWVILFIFLKCLKSIFLKCLKSSLFLACIIFFAAIGFYIMGIQGFFLGIILGGSLASAYSSKHLK